MGRDGDCTRTPREDDPGQYSSVESEIQIFPSYFPPTAVMVPKPNRRNFSGENVPPRNPDVLVTAESVAKVIGNNFQQADYSLSQSNCDIRARPSAAHTSSIGRIFDV